MSEEDIRLHANAFRTWYLKKGGQPYNHFKLWAASKALKREDKARVWDKVCRLGVAR